MIDERGLFVLVAVEVKGLQSSSLVNRSCFKHDVMAFLTVPLTESTITVRVCTIESRSSRVKCSQTAKTNLANVKKVDALKQYFNC